MNEYLIRVNETYEPLAMFPAPDMVGASQVMQKTFPQRFSGQEIHCLNITTWTTEQKTAALVEIISNCPTAQLSHFPN